MDDALPDGERLPKAEEAKVRLSAGLERSRAVVRDYRSKLFRTHEEAKARMEARQDVPAD